MFSLVFLLLPHSGAWGADSLQCCDLIFVTSPSANAITDVTNGFSNLPIDHVAIYCSELVQFSFVDKQGKRVFSPIPMSFHDSQGQITEFWIRFYKEHGMEVPEGFPGTNPGELSRRNNVMVLFQLF